MYRYERLLVRRERRQGVFSGSPFQAFLRIHQGHVCRYGFGSVALSSLRGKCSALREKVPGEEHTFRWGRQGIGSGLIFRRSVRSYRYCYIGVCCITSDFVL